MLRSIPRSPGPRILRVHLGAAGPRVERVEASELGDPWSRAANFGGSALAVALVGAQIDRDASARPLVLTVGAAVRAGTATAARCVVGGVAPLTGRYGEGQVGGELGPRLASVLDGLVIARTLEAPRREDDSRASRSSAPRPSATATRDSVLVIDARGGARLERVEGIGGRSPAERIAACTRALGPGATLCRGPAGERGVAFASLASGSPPSFVGRGGLGAVLGALGLAAVHVTAPAVAPVHDTELDRLLRASPRLVERARSGGFEQAIGEAVRDASSEASAASDWSGGWSAARDGKIGCRGCPTPCGFVFDAAVPGAGAGVRGHFGAAKSLGPRLGLDELSATIALLERCDAQGLDAKETGAVLALLVEAGEVEARADELAAAIDRVVVDDGERPRAARGGASALALQLGRTNDDATLGLAQPGAPRRDLAALALAVGAGAGTDPMRSFPFATDVGRARLAALVEPATGPLPPRTEHPEDPAGKGLLAWWHESFVAGVDASGFCVFSASGLLADGVCDLDGLAQRLIGEDGADLLARGSATVLLRAHLARRLGRPLEPEPWARAALDDGLREEYRAARGVDARGFPRAAVLASIGRATLGRPVAIASGRATVPPGEVNGGERRDGEPRDGEGGTVTLCLHGALARFGPTHRIEVGRGATLADLLNLCAGDDPHLRQALIASAPSVWRDGRRLEPDDPVRGGDELDVLAALAGG